LKKTEGVYATRAIITPPVFSRLMLSNAILFISLWWLGFFRMAKYSELPPPPPFFPITFSNREGCKHKTKKGKGSWGNENQQNQMCMLLCRLVYGKDLPWVSKSPPTQQVAYCSTPIQEIHSCMVERINV